MNMIALFAKQPRHCFNQQSGPRIRRQPCLRARFTVETYNHEKAQARTNWSDNIGGQESGKARVGLNSVEHPAFIMLTMVDVNIMRDDAGAVGIRA